MGVLIDQLYYELGLRADQLKAEGRQVAATEDAITRGAQRADAAVADLTEQLLRTPQGARAVDQFLRDLTSRLDRVAAGMTAAGIQARLLAQRQAEAAAQTSTLARPLDEIATHLGSGTREVGKFRQGLISLGLQATDTSGPIGKVIESLLTLGIGGGAVAGIAAGVAVIVKLYDTLTESARKTKEAADRAGEAVRESLRTKTGDLFQQKADLQAQIEQLQKSIAEGPRSRVSGSVTEDRQQLAELQVQLDRVNRQLAQAKQERAQQLTQALTELDGAQQRLTQSIALRLRLGLPVDELRAQLADTEKVFASVSALPQDQQADVRKALEAQIKQRQDLLAGIRADLTRSFTESLPTTIDATVEALGQLGNKLVGLEVPSGELAQDLKPLVDRLIQLRDAAFDQRLGQAAGLGPEQALEALDKLRQSLVDQLGPDQTGTDAQRILGQIARIDAAREQVNRQLVADHKAQADATEQVLDNSQGIATATATTRRSTVEIVRQLGDIARGALGIAEGFGAADDKIAAMLQNLVTIGTTLPGLIEQLGKIGKTDPTTGQPFKVDALGIASGAIGVIGGLAGILGGLGGESPAQQRLRQALESNRDAIEKLIGTIGNLNLNISGRAFASAQAGTSALLGAGLGLANGPFDLDTRRVRRILAGQGTSLSELKDVAKELGITLDTDNVQAFIRTLQQLDRALKETELTRFADTFEGQLQAFNDEVALFNLDSPLEQLQALQRTLDKLAKDGKDFSPAIQNALAGLDLADPSQRAEAKRRLQDLFTQLTTGALTPEDLGLTLDQFRDLLRQLSGLIDQVDQQQGTATGPVQETFGVTQGITEVTGSRLAGILTSLDLHAVEHIGVSRQILDVLTTALRPGGAIPAPPFPGTTAAAGPATVNITIQQMVIQTGGATGASDLRDAGAAFAQGAFEKLDRLGGAQLRARQLQVGDTVVR
jgi:hypothetical protein